MNHLPKLLSKLLVAFLVFLFLVTPLAPVFADISDGTSVPSADVLPDAPTENLTQATDPANNQKDDVVDSTDNADSSGKPPSPGLLSSVSNTPVQPISNGKNIPEPDLVTGALTYDYPISVPPGRNGMQPDLKLQYNSQDATQDNMFGYGWSINIPYIVRVNKRGTNNLFADNYFSSSLSGELVNVSGNNYTPKVEGGDFLKYSFASDAWTVTDKTGRVYVFGLQSSSREDNGDGVKIYKWMLDSVQDINGNSITYTYTKDQNKTYPLNIHYVIFDVNFSKESRQDAITSYASAFPITTAYRISQIQITVNSVVRNQYHFSYTTGDNGKRSLLQSALQDGYDVNGTATSLPATVFSYTAHQGDIFNVDVNGRVNGLSGIGTTSKGVLSGDINSDGYPDIIKAYEWTEGGYSSDKRMWVFNPAINSFAISSTYTVPATIMNYSDNSYSPYDGGTRLLDIDGDVKNDLMRTPYAYGQSAVVDKEINNGAGWTQIPNSDPKYSVDYIANPNYTLFSNDLNGDGLVDYIQDNTYVINGFPPYYRPYWNTKTSLNNGNGFGYYSTQEHSGTGTQPYAYMPAYTGDGEHLMFDINGDNLPDIIRATYTSANNSYVQKVYINNGNSWQLDNNYVLPANFAYFNNGPYGSSTASVEIADFNNDGLQDILVLGSALYINQGRSFVGSHLSNEVMSLMGNARVNPNYLIMDIGANGTPDFIVLGDPYAYFDTITTHADLLKSVTLSSGGKVDITYKTSTQYKDSNGNLLNPNLPLIIPTVNTITTTDPVNNISTADTYTYENGYYYYDASRPLLRKFAGFGTITKIDSIGNITKTYFHQGNDSNASQGEYADDYWKIGKVYRTEQYDNTNHLYAKSVNIWEDVFLAGTTKFVKLAQSIFSTYDGSLAHRDTAESFTHNNNNGNVIQKIQWGEVTGFDDGTFSDIGADKFITDYTYASDSVNIIGLPSQLTVTDQNNIKVKESKFYYDGLGQGSVTKGNLTKQEDLKSGTDYINIQKTYNSYGLPTTSTDPRGNVTQFTYDSYNLYPATIINPKTQAMQYLYDHGFGQVTQKTDSNSRVFQNSYDGLGRLLQEKQPDIATPSNLVTKTTYTYSDTPNAAYVKTSSYLDDNTIADSYTYFDGLGRKIQERQESTAANFSVKDYFYNNLGQLQKESLPYFSVGFNKTLATTNLALYANYGYDATGRVVFVTNAAGTTANIYNNWKLTTIDSNNNFKDLYKDAYGNLIQVDEHNAGSIYSTFYNYNYSQNITKITDALGNARNFTYDGLGRRLTAQDLHTPGDTTFGTWSYAYDNAGNLIQAIDPKNQTINYAYDSLGRQLTEDYTGQAGIEVTNTYDVGVDGVGKLTSQTSSAITKAYKYNPLGLLKQETGTQNSVNYTTSYDCDRQGNQILITNPDNSQIKNSYNSAGLLVQVQRKESTDSTFITVVNNFEYSPEGKVTVQSNNNGTITTNTYDANKLYRLTNKVTVNSASTHIQDLAYVYDSMGNITQMADISATALAKTVNYTYDNLYRLISAGATNITSGQTPYTQNYSYNAIGNMLTKTETIGTNPAATIIYTYASTGFANPHAVTSINDGTTTTSYTYDNNGNMTQDGIKSYAFDYNNRLIQSSTSSQSLPPITAVFHSTAGDGGVSYGSVPFGLSSIWNIAHDAAIGSVANYTNTIFNVGTGKSSAADYVVERAFIPFSTVALPDNAVITEAKLKVYVDSKLDNDHDGYDWVSVVQSSQASTNSLTILDYNKDSLATNPAEGIDTTERKNISNVATEQYLVFNLNLIGKGWISKNGFTNLGLREGHDAKNISFIGTVNQYNQLKIRSSAYTGTSFDPILEVTYSVPSISPPPTIPPSTITTYAYDPSGQRIKLSTPTTTTIYPTKFYNLEGANKTKHIFTNGQDIATIEGSGATAKIYYATNDLLNSSSIMTDVTGTLTETMDYFPFGGIRIDQKTGTFNEQRKYIGQEYDQDAGLNYLNARYYNSANGKFLSQDPMFWNFDQSWLADPQNQNSYSYARNNPIVGSDPSGKRVELISRPVFDVGGRYFGSHVFWLITPDHPTEVHINGLANGTKEFIFGGYPDQISNGFTNKLIKQIGTRETSYDKKYAFDGGPIMNRVEIKPLEGQSDTQLINSLGKAYDGIDLNGMNYRFLGNSEGLYDGNSDNFSYTLGVRGGLKDQMDAFHPNSQLTVGAMAPGYGTMLPTTSVFKQIQQAIVNIGKEINNLQNSLKNK